MRERVENLTTLKNATFAEKFLEVGGQENCFPTPSSGAVNQSECEAPKVCNWNYCDLDETTSCNTGKGSLVKQFLRFLVGHLPSSSKLRDGNSLYAQRSLLQCMHEEWYVHGDLSVRWMRP